MLLRVTAGPFEEDGPWTRLAEVAAQARVENAHGSLRAAAKV